MNPHTLDRSLGAYFRDRRLSADFDRVLLARIARESAAAARFDRALALQRAARSREQDLTQLRHERRVSWFGTLGTALGVVGIVIATAPAWQSALTWSAQPNVLAVLGLAAGLALVARALLPRWRPLLR